MTEEELVTLEWMTVELYGSRGDVKQKAKK